jgi:SET domain-containing protein
MKATVQAAAKKAASPADAKVAKNAATPAANGTATSAPAKAPAPGTTRGRLQVRQSGVHGKGVFALVPIQKGELILEYTGEVITWPEALRRHPHDPSQPDHTFYFHLSDELVIDGKVGGNASKWINHSCAPNVEADDESGQVYLLATRGIKAGEELFFDYGLVIEERYTPALKKRFECRCGAKRCRGTMLAPKKSTQRASGAAKA